MKYQKFDDAAAILLDLCLPFDEEENAVLLRKGIEFNRNEKYKQAYMTALKRFYLNNFFQIKSGKYVLQRFKELDEKLESEVKNLNVSNSPLLPGYALVEDGKSDEDKRERVQKMLEKLKLKTR